jgi:hypothetical protein
MYSLEYTEIPKVSTPHHGRRRQQAAARNELRTYITITRKE